MKAFTTLADAQRAFPTYHVLEIRDCSEVAYVPIRRTSADIRLFLSGEVNASGHTQARDLLR